jgi:hypothetical protein
MMVSDALLDSFPISRYDASVAEVLKEIAEYEKLPADWDAEGALPISPEAARLAAWLVQMVALSSRHQRGSPGSPPSSVRTPTAASTWSGRATTGSSS